MNYKIVPIPPEIAESVRRDMRSPQYGHPVFTDVAKGYGPCRQCLQTFRKGEEERILFTYNSFENLSDLPLPGPIYIHKDACRPFEGNVLPTDLLEIPIYFEAFGDESKLIRREKMLKEKNGDQIAEMFGLPEVRYINLRNAEAGCYIARIERCSAK